MNVLKLSALLVLSAAVSACATRVEYVPITPECPTVIMPVLPLIDNGDLWDILGDAEYRRNEAYTDGLWSVIDQQAAIIDKVCG